MKTPLIELKKVTKIFGKNVVLSEVDLNIPQNKIFGIIGESGSGKTTLLKTMIGFVRPDNGAVFFEGKEVNKNMRIIRDRFGFASQDNCFYPKLNARENLEFFGTLYGLNRDTIKSNINRLLKLVELEDAEYTVGENLSSGMQRRLDIACSLMNNPKVLIMDEPTQDLDPVLRKDIINLIRKINDNGTTVILTSHLLFEAEILCDEIAILHQGKILEIGTPDQLKAMYSKNQEIHLETNPGRYDLLLNNLKGDKNIVHVQHKGHKLVIFTPKAELVLKKLLAIISRSREDLVDVDLRKPSLNEVFESLVTKK